MTNRTIEDQWLRLAVEKAGNEAKLAKALGVSRQIVNRWTKIPDRFAPAVEQLYGIPREKIAPHLYEGIQMRRA